MPASISPQQLGVMADDIIDQSFPYGDGVALAGAKFREVEAINYLTGQVGRPYMLHAHIHSSIAVCERCVLPASACFRALVISWVLCHKLGFIISIKKYYDGGW